MKRALFALALLAAPAHAQPRPPYGGPPMWNQDPRDWGVEERQRRLPPRREYGPPMPGCIQFGTCRRSPPAEYGMPPFPGRPDRYDLYEEDE